MPLSHAIASATYLTKATSTTHSEVKHLVDNDFPGVLQEGRDSLHHLPLRLREVELVSFVGEPGAKGEPGRDIRVEASSKGPKGLSTNV
jgi:hypothetical protein